jgi:glycosyltransferase involved in cell wall biosynthesis
MHICHVTTAHPPRDVRIFSKECVSLAQAGHQITLLVAGKGESVIEQDVSIRIIPVNYKTRIGRILKAPRKLAGEVMAIKPDVVHFHDPEFLLCALKMKRKGFQVVYDVHEDVPRQILSKYWIPGWLRKLIAFVVEKYENSRASRLDAIIAATPFIAERFRKVNQHTDYVRNYPMPAEFHGAIQREKPHPPHLCYIGGITAIRGIREMVLAVEDADVILDLAGPVESCELFEELKKMPGWKRTIYHGTVNRKEVSRIMSAAMAGLVIFHPVPNHIDALPTKLFEYMLSGIPVIASNFPLWKEIIEQNKCGLCVDPMDVDQIKQAIQWMLNHPEEVKNMGEKARELALSQFNWDIEKQRLLAIYDYLGSTMPEQQIHASS